MDPHIQRIPIEKIWPGPRLARQQFGNQRLEALAYYMLGYGLVNPIRVRPVEDHYELLTGNRRWRAAKLLGWRTIDARVVMEERRAPRRRASDAH